MTFKRAAVVVLLGVFLLAGCRTAPQEVKTALDGDVESWRLVKKELVQKMPEGEQKALWLNRIAAFAVRARSLRAWANDEEFDTAGAVKEELNRVE